MKDKLLNDDEDIKQTYTNYQRIVSNVKEYHKKISKDDYGESQLKKDRKKLSGIVKQYETTLKSLLNKIENSDNTETIRIINEGLEKVQEDTDEKVKEIKEKLDQLKEDVNVEMEDRENIENNNEDVNGEGIQEQTQVQTNLFETEEYLQKRREELQKVHKTAAIIADTAKKIKQDLYQQGEMLNNIEENVNNAQDNVDKAGKEINKANELSKGNNKRLSCIVGIIVIAVGVVLAVVLSVVLNK